MKQLALAALLALPAAAQAQAQAQGTIALEPGDAVSLVIGADGAVSAGPRGRAEWTPFDIAAARHLSGTPIPDQPVPYATPLPDNGALPAIPPIAPGTIGVKLLSVAGEHAMLVLANGYGRAIAYRARITTRGQTRPTDVCIVIPNRHGFEYWPFRIDRLEISDMRFVAWKEGESAPCA